MIAKGDDGVLVSRVTGGLYNTADKLRKELLELDEATAYGILQTAFMAQLQRGADNPSSLHRSKRRRTLGKVRIQSRIARVQPEPLGPTRVEADHHWV